MVRCAVQLWLNNESIYGIDFNATLCSAALILRAIVDGKWALFRSPKGTRNTSDHTDVPIGEPKAVFIDAGW